MAFGGFKGVGPQLWQQPTNSLFSNMTVVDTVPQDMLYLVDKHW
jgi:hypothetical protein